MLDTSLLVGFLNEDDAHHKAGVAAMNRVMEGEWGAALLPEYVFLETMTVLMARVGLEYAQVEGGRLAKASEVEFVACSPYFGSAFEVFRSQQRTKLSFVDAAIVAIARDRGADVVGTFDRDFRKVEGLSTVPS